MAVLRQELQRTTFQDKQIKLMTEMTVNLEGIRKDIDKGVSTLGQDLTTGFDNSVERLFRSLVSYIDTGTASFIHDLSRLSDDLRSGIDEDSDDRDIRNLKEHQKQADKYRNAMDNTNNNLTDKFGKVLSSLSHIASIFGLSVDRYTDLANQYSNLQNIYVRNTSTTREDAKALRESILDTVDGLNSISDNLYSGVESYELIVGMINTTGIKNREFYEEYAEIFLESQKTMNLNLGTLAEFSDRFYRRYNFTSKTMEHLTDSIRQNTAGTSVSEDVMMQFMKELDSDIMSYAMRSGGDVESNYTRIQDNITSVYSWLNTQGYDSDYLFKLITGAASGDVSNKATLESFGISSSGSYLMQQLMSNPAMLMSNLVNAIGSRRIGTGFGDYGRQIANAYGIDYDTAVLAERKGLSYESYDEYMKNRPFSESPANELWISVEERTANATERLAATSSDLQETVGVKLTTIQGLVSDVLKLLSAVYGINIGTKIWDFFTGRFTTGLIGGESNLITTLGKAGAIAAAIYFVSDAIIGEIQRSERIKAYGQHVAGATDTAINEGTYATVDATGLASTTDTRQTIGQTSVSASNAYNAAIDASASSQTLSDTSTRWILKNIFGWSDREVDESQTNANSPGAATGIKYRVALANVASSFAADGDNRLINMLQAYNNKGLLSEDWMWGWLAGSPSEGYDTNNLKYALKEFESGRLIIPKKKSFLGITYGYDKTGKNSYDTVPAYKLGTPYVPGDQLAMLHEGEAVIPALENPFSKYSTSRYNRNEDLRAIAENTKELASSKPDDHGIEFRRMVEYMKDIFEFLQYWRDDNISRESVSEVLQSAKNTNLRLQILTGEASLATDSM